MSDPLYSHALLRLAANAAGSGRLPHPDATGTAINPTCGDKVTVTLVLNAGRIAAIAHETKACVITQASASILGAHLNGLDAVRVRALRDDVAAMLKIGVTPPSPFADYVTLKAVAEYPARHTCVLLPIDAVLDALNQT